MDKGYKYEVVTCGYCERDVALNWYVRHMKRYHWQTEQPQPELTQEEYERLRRENDYKAGAYH